VTRAIGRLVEFIRQLDYQHESTQRETASAADNRYARYGTLGSMWIAEDERRGRFVL
jgi:hypothetical protein